MFLLRKKIIHGLGFLGSRTRKRFLVIVTEFDRRLPGIGIRHQEGQEVG